MDRLDPLLGTGKSTLLQILAGKRLIKNASAQVLGQNVFFNTPPVRFIYLVEAGKSCQA